MKKYFEAVEDYSRQPSPESLQDVQNRLSAAYSKIDKAVKRGILHSNNGARKKSRLVKRFKNVQAQMNPASAETSEAS